jgi:hypothetical protein
VLFLQRRVSSAAKKEVRKGSLTGKVIDLQSGVKGSGVGTFIVDGHS